MRKKLPVLIGLIAIGVIILSYFIKDLMVNWIIPPLFGFFQMIESRQDTIWIYFLFVMFLYIGMWVIKSYADIRSLDILGRRKKENNEGDIGRLEIVADMIKKTNDSAYSKVRIARYLSELIVNVQAHQRRESPGNILSQLKNGTLSVPDNLGEYMKASLLFKPEDMNIKRRWLFWKKRQTSALDLNPKTVVEYLETQLDMRNRYGNQ